MAGVFEIIDKYTADLEEKMVTKINLVIGEMTNAIPDALEAAFSVYAPGTKAAGAKLEIRLVPLSARCENCKWEGNIEKHSFVCPHCSSIGLEIITGRELYVESLEVD